MEAVILSQPTTSILIGKHEKAIAILKGIEELQRRNRATEIYLDQSTSPFRESFRDQCLNEIDTRKRVIDRLYDKYNKLIVL